jgi:hypothetical protein
VIKIRYSDLPGGLHLSADVRGNHTILFLLPGLTAAQRKAAIRRARSAARVGHGPVLPALGLARAVAADRIATTVRNGLAAMRMHPAVFLPPMIMVLSAAIAYVLLVSVSIRLYPPQAAGKGPVLGAARPGTVYPAPGSRPPGNAPASGSAPGGPGGRPRTARPARRHRARRPRPRRTRPRIGRGARRRRARQVLPRPPLRSRRRRRQRLRGRMAAVACASRSARSECA